MTNIEVTNIEVTDDLRHHFHLFWDQFIFPVMLVHKSFTILDRNRAAEAIGCTPGTRCIDMGEKKQHRGCLASKALREQTSKRSVEFVPEVGRVIDSYWIPLEGYPEFYVHFAIDLTEYAADRFFPGERPKVDANCSACII